MAQPSITNYFQKRKRLEGINSKSSAKVLVLETDVLYNSSQCRQGEGAEDSKLKVPNQTILYKSSTQTMTYSDINRPRILDKNDAPLTSKKSHPGDKISKRGTATKSMNKTRTKNSAEKSEVLPDIRKTFLKQTVKFELKGSLSPKKKPDQEQSTSSQALSLSPTKSLKSKEELPSYVQNPEVVKDGPSQESGENLVVPISLGSASSSNINYSVVSEPSCSKTVVEVVSTTEARRELGLMNPKRNDSELSLNEIKSRLTRSAKLSELRESLAKISKGKERLKDIEHRKSQLDTGIPKLGKFKTIAMEVRSPMKDVTSSPQKSTSPLSTPTKVPAYQRYSSLAVAGPPVLTLPYKHRCLVEVFRCVDTVVAMLHNRKEKITFSKLKPAVQQMLRKNLMETHLGQIKRVFPNAYAFHQEKCHTFGSAATSDKYELTMTPLIDKLIEHEESSMLPSCLLERRKTFADNLTERVQDLHEQFLLSLDPPLTISRDKLTRWHPEFDLDNVPDVDADTLPAPPNQEHYSTASDVLAKAKHIFSCNQRMEQALLRVSELSVKNKPTNTTPTKPPLSAALRGIPKALLEKVRANQAAKAMVVMSRSAAEERQGTQYSRLPEMARIIRNLYVAEKKGVLPMEVALQKIGNSFRENLPTAELDEHVQLLVTSVPGWLQVHEIRKARFLKLSKNSDMTKVMKRLEELAAENK